MFLFLCFVIDQRKLICITIDSQIMSTQIDASGDMLRINDQLLLDSNRTVTASAFSFNDYVDARVHFDCSREKNVVSIGFVSVLNLTAYELECVHVLIDVFEGSNWIHRTSSLQASHKISVLRGGAEELYDEAFEFEFDASFELDNIEMRVYIVGNVVSGSRTKRILGGARLFLGDIN